MKKSLKILLFLCVFLLIIASVSICYASNIRSSEITFDQFDVGKTDMSGPSSSINNIIGAAITLFQMFCVGIAVIIVVVSFLKYIISKIKLSGLTEDDEQYEEKKEKYLNTSKKAKKRFIICLIVGFVLYSAAAIIGLTKTFKPIIYIYPESDNTNVSITLSNPEKITCSYPKYNDGWNVEVNKDGTISDGNRNYYALYWEGLINKKDFKDGFVVKGENTAEFLEEKLKILGLTDREAEEFIVYWLPKMEKNNYNLIRFLEEDELNEEMELNINPKPDTLIRIQMQYKPLLFNTDIPEQELTEVERNGYTIVEWGGSKV